jgi:hypothetical protein
VERQAIVSDSIAKADADLQEEMAKAAATVLANRERIGDLEGKLRALRGDKAEEDREQGVQIQGEDGDIEVEY